jgi:hypothetical protein
MFDTIILLADLVEQQALATLLLEYNPLLNIVRIFSAADLGNVGADVLERARLIAFTTTVIVPRAVLDRLGYGAYNFHPGPPEYPGWAPAHFALYECATEFGATAHAMVEQVDAGAVVQVERFLIPTAATVAGLEEVTYTRLARMFWRLAKTLATQAEPLETLPIRWSARKNTRRRYAAMCDIPLDISSAELQRRIDIFGDNHFGITPTIHLHGVEFRATRGSTFAAAPSPSLVPTDDTREQACSEDEVRPAIANA